MKLRTVLILGVLLTGTAGSFWRFGVQRSVLDVSRDDVHFPTVSGTNLDRQEMTFPADFAGALNILFVPFLQSQQPVVDTWVPFAQDAEAAFPGVVYYELPTINNMPGLARTFINEGMRAGIPDQTSRERTVTLYIDMAKFMGATGITGRDEVHTLLVNRDGDILWRTTGAFDEEKGEGLKAAILANR
ncbi:MAG: hypothetical protein KBG20_15515 [Caldilineaceae bacterium]|nr:hypothetical protein [Caldilineaceae bacterium]MBP8106357.1 hypothetical protein [Caldilineaceae bacterium]MBP8121460.1 hypothetical protein [Caldilineaceae bacterium]MBP9073715.1 hypothetical protein [Caldilineaceae bacterium]